MAATQTVPALFCKCKRRYGGGSETSCKGCGAERVVYRADGESPLDGWVGKLRGSEHNVLQAQAPPAAGEDGLRVGERCAALQTAFEAALGEMAVVGGSSGSSGSSGSGGSGSADVREEMSDRVRAELASMGFGAEMIAAASVAGKVTISQAIEHCTAATASAAGTGAVDVSRLETLGFAADDIAMAMRNTDNDVNAALELLLARLP